MASTTVTQTASESSLILKKKKEPKEIFRKDYKAPLYWIRYADLSFRIFEGHTFVEATLTVERDPTTPHGSDLVLNGEQIELVSLAVDDSVLKSEDTQLANGGSAKDSPYSVSHEDDTLTIKGDIFPEDASKKFLVKTKTKIVPEENHQLSGLYKSGGMYCTQCEPHGFRRITFYLDRPDVMALFKCRVEAPSKYKVLLSNGNEIDRGTLDGDRHYALFEDPWPKPNYLFAVVAGDLECIKDTFTTSKGDKVELGIYSEPHNVNKLDWAVESLKKAMKWDEDRFGRVYDLNTFNIVAVDDFNMGAMENKGLNVFNTALLLATKDMSTDADFRRILGVVGHEYFHNWTGNRVTCRDWFQLTLKEGLTVYRDQEFSRDLTSPSVVRIEDVLCLRAVQFQEDAGPMSHPIRPESYIAMDNFYTSTVYNKGAEVIRMYATLLGRDGFRKGTDLYFERHDGKAVTCDDFRAAMADANKRDFSQFERWYLQSGTPVVTVSEQKYDASSKTFTLTCQQSTPSTAGQPSKKPFHIPLRTALLSRASGKEIANERVLELKEEKQSFTFEGVEEEPVLSILRDFSAPVRLKMDRKDEDLAFLLANETDPFNQWEAGQVLMTNVAKQVYQELKSGTAPDKVTVPDFLVKAWRQILECKGMDKWVQSYSIRFPDTRTLANDETDPYDPCLLSKARKLVRAQLAVQCKDSLMNLYQSLSDAAKNFQGSQIGQNLKYDSSNEACGTRALRNACLGYLSAAAGECPEVIKLVRDAYFEADNATDKMAALSLLADCEGSEREEVLKAYYADAKGNSVMICKWLGVQAGADLDNCLDTVKQLLQHPDFSLKTPNKVRALIGGFCSNMAQFHRADGKGYEFLTDQIIALDKMNPQMASRLCTPLGQWHKVEPKRSAMMKKALEKLRDVEGLSDDAAEIVIKSLK